MGPGLRRGRGGGREGRAGRGVRPGKGETQEAAPGGLSPRPALPSRRRRRRSARGEASGAEVRPGPAPPPARVPRPPHQGQEILDTGALPAAPARRAGPRGGAPRPGAGGGSARGPAPPGGGIPPCPPRRHLPWRPLAPTRRGSVRERPNGERHFYPAPPPAPPRGRARPPRPRAPHLARQLRTRSASPGRRPAPRRWHRAAKPPRQEGRGGAACLSAKDWSRGGGGGARRCRPPASLPARGGAAPALRPPRQRGRRARGPSGVGLLFNAGLLQPPTKLERLSHGPSACPPPPPP